MSVVRNRARIDKLLVNISRKQKLEGTIADEVLTSVNVVQQSGLIGKYDKSHLRIVHDLVGGETPYPQIVASVKDSDRYSLEKHGLKGVVTEEDKMNEEQPFDARKDKTQDLTDKITLGRELALSTTLTDTGVITKNVTLAGTDQFNDYDNSEPLERFNVARASIYDNTGQIVEAKGGFAIVPWNVMNQLKFHPALIENIKHTVNLQQGLSLQQLKASMGVDRIMMPWARYNNSKEGQADVLAPVWGKHIVFGYAPRNGSKRIETLGFDVKRRSNVRVFTKAIDNPPNADQILVDIEYDFLLTETNAAYLIKDAIA